MKILSKINDLKKDIFFILLPTVLGIVLCAACLAGTSFAWFTASEISPQNITAAEYTVDVSVTDADAPLNETDGVYSLAPGKTYRVTLTATGNASTGYCIVKLGEETYHTLPFPSETVPDGVMTLTLVINEATTLKITPQWGSSARPLADRWGNNHEQIYNGK